AFPHGPPYYLFQPLLPSNYLPTETYGSTSPDEAFYRSLFNNPNSEINVWGEDVLKGLTDIVQGLQNDTEKKTILFTSDVPKYFLAHLDVLSQLLDPTISQRSVELFYRLTSLPQVTIGAINGVAR
ncbi:hypothetical protein GT037_003370, partial [Alternaria burnsii]